VGVLCIFFYNTYNTPTFLPESRSLSFGGEVPVKGVPCRKTKGTIYTLLPPMASKRRVGLGKIVTDSNTYYSYTYPYIWMDKRAETTERFVPR
jgi:hypothetical protein